MPGRAFNSSSLAVFRSSGAFFSALVSVLAVVGLESVLAWAYTAGALRAPTANSRATRETKMRVMCSPPPVSSMGRRGAPLHSSSSYNAARGIANDRGISDRPNWLVGQPPKSDAHRSLAAGPGDAQIYTGSRWRTAHPPRQLVGALNRSV